MKLTTQQIKDLAEVERMMDAGEVPFVTLRGRRLAMSETVMKSLGLVKGQTISADLFVHIIQLNIAECQAAIQARKQPH